jgi:phosphomannomutase
VALDFTNGSCAAVARKLLQGLGATLIPLNHEPTGLFTHPPAPCAANLRQAAALVVERGADLGAGINVDGDRIAFVTGDGRALSEEHTLPLAARSRLVRRPGTIVTSLSTSGMVEEVARRSGQKVVRTPVGESHVMDRGLTEEAVLAGEGSGGVGMLPATLTFDGLLTLGMVLESMATEKAALAALVEDLPRLAIRKGELACPPDLIYKVLEGFRAGFADRSPDTSDGVRLTWDDAWVHVRASNTEPLLRVIVEARTEERVQSLFKDAMSRAWRLASGSGGNLNA